MTSDSRNSKKLAELAFGDALQSLSEGSGGNMPFTSIENLSDGTVEGLIAAFEEVAHLEDEGLEFWLARDLQKLLGYSDYRNFLNIVAKAKDACLNSGHPVEHHFVDVTDMIEVGKGAMREVDNIKLTRYAAYLVAQNGDSRKQPVAFAQTYFAVQTRKQEMQDDEMAQYTPLSEDQKRVLLRNEIKEHNKNLASAAKGAGVVEPLDFAIFQNHGYKGLYGGLDKNGIQRAKGLKSKSNILDHMGSTELAANLFRATQTEEKLRRENIKGKANANNAHHEVGKKVRQAIIEIGGTMPEKLAPAEDIVKVGRRLAKAIAGSQVPDKDPPKKLK